MSGGRGVPANAEPVLLDLALGVIHAVEKAKNGPDGGMIDVRVEGFSIKIGYEKRMFPGIASGAVMLEVIEFPPTFRRMNCYWTLVEICRALSECGVMLCAVTHPGVIAALRRRRWVSEDALGQFFVLKDYGNA